MADREGSAAMVQRQTTSRLDSATFWVAVSAVVGLLGFGSISVAAIESDATHKVTRNVWFWIGVGGVGLCVVLLLFAIVLYVRHRRSPETVAQPSTTPEQWYHAERIFEALAPTPEARRVGVWTTETGKTVS